MNCVLITDQELVDRGLEKFIQCRLPVYMRGSPVSIAHNPLSNVYIVPSTHPAFSWLAAAGAGRLQYFSPEVVERMGWNEIPND